MELDLSKKLIITEKPSVARDFARVLGVQGNKNGYIENDEYAVTWCVGHLVGLLYPEDYDPSLKNWKLEDLPFLPEDYKYGVIDSVKQQYAIVNGLLHREDIDTVYWAGDSGKEGQTIEENIRNFGGVRQGMIERRVWIDSQTDEEIKRGIREAKPMSDYANLGLSGIMRTIEDYALGINFSRVLSVKYGRILNNASSQKNYVPIAVGRVMTCVLGMVVNREREIRNFSETPFYRVIGYFTDDKIPAEWKAVEGSEYFNSPLLYKENGFKKKESADNLINELTGKSAIVDSINKSTQKKKAPPLFNLAELQAQCAKMFKISPGDVLNIAQELYERKLTTYPRTDARVLTTAVAKEIDKNIKGLIGYEPLSEHTQRILNEGLYKGIEKSSYTDDSKVTDHYAIIPTGQLGALNGLNDLQRKVYDLIVRRFLSIFYPAAEYTTVKMVLNIEKEQFFVSSKVLDKKGYMEIAGVAKNDDNKSADKDKKADNKNGDIGKEADDGEDDEDIGGFNKEKLLEIVKHLKKGSEIKVDSFDIKEGKTSPPKRYTSGTMILAMENAGNLIEDEELRAQIKNCGIGTSATRAGIIEKLVGKTGFIKQNPKTLILTPEKLGEMVYEVVDLTVPSLLNPEMSASWEKGLEDIINGSVLYKDYRIKLEEYIRTETCKMIETNVSSELLKRIADINPEGNPVPGIDTGCICPDCSGRLLTTPFGYGCENYKDENVKCKFSLGTVAGLNIPMDEFKNLINNGKTGVIKGFKSKSKKSFSACLVLNKNDDGKHTVNFDFSDNTPDIIEGVTCPKCGGNIYKTSFGYGCSNFKDENIKCNFSVGKICSKNISETQLVKLLNDGKTDLIKGFKAKSGSQFDAFLTIDKEDNGDFKGIVFAFEDNDTVLQDIKCPMCGKSIIKNRFGYRCEDYDREKESGCKFSLNKIAGVTVSENDFRELVNNGITPKITGFKSKTGSDFAAQLMLTKNEEGKVSGFKFVF